MSTRVGSLGVQLWVPTVLVAYIHMRCSKQNIMKTKTIGFHPDALKAQYDRTVGLVKGRTGQGNAVQAEVQVGRLTVTRRTSGSVYHLVPLTPADIWPLEAILPLHIYLAHT